jgi:hypothetical protein
MSARVRAGPATHSRLARWAAMASQGIQQHEEAGGAAHHHILNEERKS